MKSISILEKIGIAVSVILLALSYYYRNTTTQGILINIGTTVLAASIASMIKDWHWRSFFSKYKIDPHVIVYQNRANYNNLIEEIETANNVDFMGISLQYVIEYIHDHTREISQKIKKIRILLPHDSRICDERDKVQGTKAGTLKNLLKQSLKEIDIIDSNYPSSFDFKYFTVQPYFAFTRIDNVIWISPYIAKTGKSSPLLKISKSKSPELFELFLNYYESIWKRSIDEKPILK